MYGQRIPSGQIPIQSSLDYEIPQSFISRDQGQPQEPQVEPSSNLGKIEDPAHPLAARGKLTSDYYNNYAQLEQYAKSMAKDFGVDIFKPDYTQEGGGHAFQLAQKLQANIMYAANALKNEFSAEKDRRQAIDEGKLLRKHGVDYNNTLAYSDDSNFIPTAALPGITEANMRGREDTFDPQSAARINQQIQAQSGQIDQLVQSGQLSPEEGQLQKSYLVKNSYKLSSQQLTDDGGSGGKAVKSMIPLYERATNVSRGAFDGTDKVVKGQHFLAAPIFSGDAFGEGQLSHVDKVGNESVVKAPKQVKGVLKDSSGRVFFEFENPNIPLERIDNLDPAEFYRRLVESNSGKYGGVGSLPAFYQELEKKGYTDQSRAVHPSTVYGEGTVEKTKSRPASAQIDAILKFDKKRFEDASVGKVKDFYADTPQGKYHFEYDEDKGVSLKNWKDLGFKNKIDNLSYEEYLNLMDKVHYHSQFVLPKDETPKKATPTTAASKSITKSQLKSLIGKPGYEGYDEKELINYYKGQGFKIQ